MTKNELDLAFKLIGNLINDLRQDLDLYHIMKSDSMFNVVKSRIKMLQSNIDYFYKELINESDKI